MEQQTSYEKEDISRIRAFVAGVCDTLPGIIVPIPVMLFALFVLQKCDFYIGMAGVNAFLPFLFAWWAVPLGGAVYAVFRIGHQRRVFWLTVTIGLVYGGLIPSWIVLHDLLEWPK